MRALHFTRPCTPSACMALLTLGCLSLPVHAMTGKQVYDIVSRSVVIVHTPTGLGSGVVIAKQLIATNCHVVQANAMVEIEFFKVRTVADVVGRNEQHDVCVVRLKEPLPGAEPVRGVRSWASINVGEVVYTLGAPTGFRYTGARKCVRHAYRRRCRRAVGR